MGEVKAQIAACPICGNSVKIAASETSFDRSTTREFAKLMEMGYEIKSVSLEYARTNPMYCEHNNQFNKKTKP